MPKLEPLEKMSRFRTLKALIPFFESQGFVVKKGVDHLVVYPYDMTKIDTEEDAHSADVKIDGAQVLKDLESVIKQTILDGVDKMIKKYEILKNNLEGK